MTQSERLRALLKEALEWLVNGTCRECDRRGGCKMRQRIDAALAEPDEAEETEHQMHLRIRAGYDAAIADSWRAKVAEVERELEQARAEAAAYKRDFEAELAGNAALRQKHGARDNETMFDFIARIVRERDDARALRAASDQVLSSGVVVSAEKYAELVRAAGPNVSFLDELRLANERAEAAQRERDEARAEVERLRDALALSEVDVALERTWCRICRTENRSNERSRDAHPHEARCPLARKDKP